MKKLTLFPSLLAAGGFAVGFAVVPGFAQAPPLPPDATVYASGLEGPRGMTFGPDGSLYVAEAGLGGTRSTVGVCPQTPGPVGPYTSGPTARISKIDSEGVRTTLVSGLPSAVAVVGDHDGVADVAFLDGNLYALLAGGGCSHGNPTQPNALIKVNLKSGKWTTVSDLSAALVDFPAKYTSPDDYEPDGTWFGMTVSDGRLYVVSRTTGRFSLWHRAGRCARSSMFLRRKDILYRRQSLLWTMCYTSAT